MQSRMQEQVLQGDSANRFPCQRGMHFQLDKSKSDHHIVNPYAEGDEEQHLVLPKGLNIGESYSGQCNEMVFGTPVFEVEAKEKLWDIDQQEPMGFLDGSLEVKCVGSSSLEIVQYSCREHLPFSIIWKEDTTTQKAGWATPQGSQFEYAEFACGDPFSQSGPDLLQDGSVHELAMLQVQTLQEALTACEQEEQCAAVAVSPDRSKHHMFNKFACKLVPEALETSFNLGDKVKLTMIAQGVPLDGKEASPEASQMHEGVVLEKWNLDAPETHVLVQFEHGAERILPEHLQHRRASWTVISDLFRQQ